jgi:pimeloyl-ACP methyl ester carboxylesterase
MSTTTPTFICIPGAFCPAHYFHKVLSLLQASGYDAHAIDLPSMDVSLHEKGERPGLYTDAAHVRSFINSLPEAQDVILIGSSYGGAVALESCKDIVTRVRHVVLLCSLMADEGFTIASLTGGNLPIDPSVSPYMPPMPASVAAPLFFPSLPQAEQDELAAMMKPLCAQALLDPLSFAAWKEVGTTSVVGDKDAAMPMETQVQFFDEAVRDGAKGARKVVVEGGEHLVMLTHPDLVVRVCLEAAGVEDLEG